MACGNYSEYLTTFNPSGRLIQLENALAAVSRGAICLGITSSNGVVIAVDNTPPSPLYDVHSVRRVEMITEQIGMVYSGVGPDYRILVKAARKSAQLYYLTHMNLIPVTELAKNMATVMENFTQPTGVRPFGVSLLICSWSACRPYLYQVEPTGLYSAWKATALGNNAVRGKEFLVERYCEVLDTEDAIYTALLALKHSIQCEMISENIEIGISDDKGFRRLSQESIQEYWDCLDF